MDMVKVISVGVDFVDQQDGWNAEREKGIKDNNLKFLASIVESMVAPCPDEDPGGGTYRGWRWNGKVCDGHVMVEMPVNI